DSACTSVIGHVKRGLHLNHDLPVSNLNRQDIALLKKQPPYLGDQFWPRQMRKAWSPAHPGKKSCGFVLPVFLLPYPQIAHVNKPTTARLSCSFSTASLPF